VSSSYFGWRLFLILTEMARSVESVYMYVPTYVWHYILALRPCIKRSNLFDLCTYLCI
jgi:hypothetical protein